MLMIVHCTQRMLLLKTLESETTIILDWFRLNEMKPNDDKCHLIVCNHDNLSVKLGNEKLNQLRY